MATVSAAAGTNTQTNRREESISRIIARFAHGLRYEDIPSAVIERAKLHILDAIGIAFASSTYDFARRSMDALLTLGRQPAGHGTPRAAEPTRRSDHERHPYPRPGL
jgi:hypothetical protein